MENVKEDVRIAQHVIEGDLLIIFEPTFHSHSIIYPSTNEKISSPIYKDSLKNKEKILSVIGSGDQILNSVLLGSKQITGFDISCFTGYYLKLKIAALKSLNYHEYLSFFSCQSKNRFSKKIYEKIIPYLDSDTEYFWSSIFSLYDAKVIGFSNLFVMVNNNKFKQNNPYLESKEEYELLKSKIKDIDLKLIYKDIFELVNELTDKYNLINLSNIVDYNIKGVTVGNIVKIDCRSREKINRLLRNLPMEDEGITLMYSMDYNMARMIDVILTSNEMEHNEYEIDCFHKLILSRKRK